MAYPLSSYILHLNLPFYHVSCTTPAQKSCLKHFSGQCSIFLKKYNKKKVQKHEFDKNPF